MADYIEKDAWRGILREDIKLSIRNDRDIFAYAFYENTDSESGESFMVPFLILGDENMSIVQERIASSNDAYKFPTQIMEMGKTFPAKIGISHDRIAISRKSDYFNGRDLVFVGERKDDKFYHGFWGFSDSGNWQGRFHTISDLECPYDFR